MELGNVRKRLDLNGAWELAFDPEERTARDAWIQGSWPDSVSKQVTGPSIWNVVQPDAPCVFTGARPSTSMSMRCGRRRRSRRRSCTKPRCSRRRRPGPPPRRGIRRGASRGSAAAKRSARRWPSPAAGRSGATTPRSLIPRNDHPATAGASSFLTARERTSTGINWASFAVQTDGRERRGLLLPRGCGSELPTARTAPPRPQSAVRGVSGFRWFFHACCLDGAVMSGLEVRLRPAAS